MGVHDNEAFTSQISGLLNILVNPKTYRHGHSAITAPVNARCLFRLSPPDERLYSLKLRNPFFTVSTSKPFAQQTRKLIISLDIEHCEESIALRVNYTLDLQQSCPKLCKKRHFIWFLFVAPDLCSPSSS